MNYPSDEFDTANFLPASVSGPDSALQTSAEGLADVPPMYPRQPNLGYGLLALVIGFFIILAVSLAVLAIGQGLHLLPPLRQITPDSMPGATVLTEAIGYLCTLAIIVPLFRRMWHRPFAEVLQVNLPFAVRNAGKFMLLGVLLAVSAQWIESHMVLPHEMPIDAFFRSRATVWLVAVFGTLIAPVVEELIFRGFLLRGFAIAFDWLRYPKTDDGRLAWKTTDSISRPAWIFSAILTSVLFAAMHAAQLGGAWNAVAVLSLIGGALAAVRLRFNSLAASSLVHISYNGLIFVVLFFATEGFRNLDKIHLR